MLCDYLQHGNTGADYADLIGKAHTAVKEMRKVEPRGVVLSG